MSGGSGFTTPWAAEFNWDRLRFMAGRVARQEGVESEEPVKEMAEEFLKSVDDGLERIYCAVPEELVAEFRERSIEDLGELCQRVPAVMRVVRGIDEGRKALSRASGEGSTPTEVLEGIKRIFGEELTPEGAVSRIVSGRSQPRR